MNHTAYSVVFFGSFQHYSALVLENLIKSPLIQVEAVITTPPHPDRKGKLIKNSVHEVAEKNKLPVWEMKNLVKNLAENQTSSKNLSQPDFVITAGFGQLVPNSLLEWPKIKALNLHFSLLPQYRGANPGEWAILMDEKESGISVIEMSEKFDEGNVVFQKAISLDSQENRETLYHKLYELGGEVLPQVITDYAQQKLTVTPQTKKHFYATRLKKNDGFLSWELVQTLIQGQKVATQNLNSSPKANSMIPTQELISPQLQIAAQRLSLTNINPKFIERATRALYGFPSLWTIVPTSKGPKRMKIWSAKVQKNGDTEQLQLLEVQIEGQQKALFNQIKNSITE